jgi:hypothetical protein
MDQALVLDAKPTTQFAYSVRGKSRKTKYIRKGMLPLAPAMDIDLTIVDMWRC